MPNAISARIQGDDYQARLFWLFAARLFAPHARATRIGWEVKEAKGFEDLALYYDTQYGDGIDTQINVDYFQSKFHVAYDKPFTAMDLIDPRFLGGKKSVLQRLLDAQRSLGVAAERARFILVAPTAVDPTDPLAELLSCDDGSIRTDRLMAGKTTKSKMGNVRNEWRKHLELDSDEQLLGVIKKLRIRSDFATLEGLREQLNYVLPSIGFDRHSEGKLGTVYDGLPAKLLQKGRNVFDKAAIHAIGTQEGLITAGPPSRPVAARGLGIRSFQRWAEHMEDEVESVLCLLSDFDKRDIREGIDWNNYVLPKLKTWLDEKVSCDESIELHLDTHSSIAFAAGWFLPSKSGARVNPVQRTRKGREVWCPERCPECSETTVWSKNLVDLDNGGKDLATVISVTHDIASDVRGYISTEVATIGRVVALTPSAGCSPSCVRDAAHALRMAHEAVRLARESLQGLPRNAVVHVFAAAPNGLLFFLGQHASVLGTCQTYEHDFGRQWTLPYKPAIQLAAS